MSHPVNDAFLEGAAEDFQQADNKKERLAVIQRLRDAGFEAQANTLQRAFEGIGLDY